MDEDWRNAIGILMCTEICDGAGARICDGSPSTCSTFIFIFFKLCIVVDIGKKWFGNVNREIFFLSAGLRPLVDVQYLEN